MARSFAFFIGVALGGSLLPAPLSAQLWKTFLGPTSTTGRAADAKVDGAGDVIAVGNTFPNTGDSDITVAKVSGATGAVLWRSEASGTDPGGYDQANRVALDSAGDAFVAGRTKNAGTLWDFTVAKFAGTSGAEIWRYTLNGTANDAEDALAVAVDSAGDALAAGQTVDATSGSDFTVVKLAGATGAEIWRYDIAGPSFDRAHSIAVDAAGDVVVGGTSAFGTVVVKLAGGTGAELWRYDTAGLAAFAVRVDAAGDVALASSFPSLANGFDMSVAKLAGGTGAELWRAQVDGAQHSDDQGVDLAFDSSGDVVAAGAVREFDPFEFDFAVAKFSGVDGSELWRRVVDGTAQFSEDARTVAIDAAGDVVAAGVLDNLGSGLDFAVLALDGSTGSQRWLRSLKGTGAFEQGAFAVDLLPGGDVAAAGGLDDPAGSFTVVRLDGVTGGDFLLSGVKLSLRTPSDTRILLTSRDRERPLPTPGAGDDPTIGGAVLEIVNPSTLETDTVALPAG